MVLPLPLRPFSGRLLSTAIRRFATSSATPSSSSSSAFSKSSFPPPLYPVATGTPSTIDYRVFFHLNSPAGSLNSPWHSLPLIYSYYHPSTGSLASNRSAFNPIPLYHFINEIPLGTRPKMEIDTTSPHNPIKQDIKKGKLREFSYGSIPFNYGALSQTWENPLLIEKKTKCYGDNDPIDVVELSRTPIPLGSIVPLRIFGSLALIDEGECDWKILAASPYSELFFADINLSHNDFLKKEKEMIDIIRDWFINYKTTDGKEKNRLAEGGKIFSVEETLEIIEENHQQWKQLISGTIAHNDKTKKLWIPSAK